MAIRFQCASCSEPIEVDDEWARQVVRCPYCQRTVTAPAESMLPPAEQIPVAKGIATRREFDVPADPVGPAGAVPLQPPLPPTNRAAATAMILILVSIGFYLMMIRSLENNAMAWKEYERILAETMKQNGSSTSAMMKYIEAQGGVFPSWMLVVLFSGLGWILGWLGAVIFGILGLFRPVRRGVAVGALSIAGMMLLLSCLSAIVGPASNG